MSLREDILEPQEREAARLAEQAAAKNRAAKGPTGRSRHQEAGAPRSAFDRHFSGEDAAAQAKGKGKLGTGADFDAYAAAQRSTFRPTGRSVFDGSDKAATPNRQFAEVFGARAADPRAAAARQEEPLSEDEKSALASFEKLSPRERPKWVAESAEGSEKSEDGEDAVARIEEGHLTADEETALARFEQSSDRGKLRMLGFGV